MTIHNCFVESVAFQTFLTISFSRIILDILYIFERVDVLQAFLNRKKVFFNDKTMPKRCYLSFLQMSVNTFRNRLSSVNLLMRNIRWMMFICFMLETSMISEIENCSWLLQYDDKLDDLMFWSFRRFFQNEWLEFVIM